MPIPAGITWTTADPNAPFSTSEVPTATKLSAIVSHIYDRQGDTTHGGHGVSNIGLMAFGAAGYFNSNVGIGVVPGAKLHVTSGTTKTNTGNTTIAIFGAAAGDTNPLQFVIRHSYGGSRAHLEILGTEYALSGADVDLNETMTVKYGGNVGIGTVDPKAKLHVVGLASYLNNAAAVAAGLTAGAMYIVTGTNPAQVAIVT